jgi:hypothetical protein
MRVTMGSKIVQDGQVIQPAGVAWFFPKLGYYGTVKKI